MVEDVDKSRAMSPVAMLLSPCFCRMIKMFRMSYSCRSLLLVKTVVIIVVKLDFVVECFG